MASPEALLISALLRTQNAAPLTQHGITSDLFDAHNTEFKWIERYIAKHERVPSKTAFRSKFPECPVFRADDIESFCEDVRRDYAQRRLTDLMDESIDLMMEGRIEAAVDKMQTDMLSIQAAVTEVDVDYDISTSWEQTYSDVMERVSRVKVMGSAGVPTGFATWDLVTGGLQPGWVCIIGGRLGTGKTWVMTKMAVEAAMSGYKALFLSLEQSRHQIAMRTHTLLSRRLSSEVFRANDLMRGYGFDLLKYKEFLEDIDGGLPGSLMINDTSRGRIGPMEVAAMIERTQPDIVFIDYMTLLKQKGDGGWQSVGELSSDLQQVAQRFQVPLVVASQLNRQAIGQDRADPGTLSRSDAIGQDADMIVTVARKSKSVRKMHIAKNRHGEDGSQWFTSFRPGNADFDEIDGDTASELQAEDEEVD